MSKLRECPMCKGKEIYFSEGDTHRWMNIACNCGVKFEVAKADSAKPAGHSVNTVDAIKQWNDRAPDPQVAKLQEQVRVLREALAGSMKVITLVAQTKDGSTAVYLESRRGHFIECATTLQSCESALAATAPNGEGHAA
jgi:hypothetical protein